MNATGGAIAKINSNAQSRLFASLALALLASAGVLWIATGEVLLVLAYSLGIAVLLAGGLAFQRMQVSPQAEHESLPDWSVTVAAIEVPGEGVAITDRANRLACANTAYVDWFGVEVAPPNLALSRASQEELVRMIRQAWRDGSARSDMLESVETGTRWKVRTDRAGRSDNHLVWRFAKIEPEIADPLASYDVTGAFGRMLAKAGIEAAITAPDGNIKSASAGFAERATGDAHSTLAGQDFVSFLRSDDRDRIFFSREGRSGTPQTLIHVPLDDPSVPLTAGPDEALSLMLLIDAGVGIGGGWENSSQGTAQLESLLAQLPLGLAMTDRDGRFLFSNSAFLRSVQREEQGLPSFPTDLVVREDKAALSDAVRRHGRGPSTSGNMAIRLAGEPDDTVSLGLAGVRGMGDAAVLLSLTDSSQETQLKRQVAQATKMQAVGQLAGGVAHDFNNVLTAIIGTCDLMLLRHTPGDSDYDDIQQIQQNSNRAASLTRQLLAFSRQQTLRPEILQLPDVVSEVGPLITRLLGEKIEYNVKHDRNLGPVRADPQQLEQVIMNLAVNARDAINTRRGGNGKISLTTRRVNMREVEQMGSEILPAANYTVLVVEDTGGGIPQQVMPKLFEPFFTTKEQGKGTGLGLSTAYGIVKQSGGFLFADNVKGTGGRTIGARFTMYLPVHDGPVAAAPEAPVEEASSEWSGGGRLLLVEDEDMVRAVAERALSRAGYEVTACSDGEEGLSAITSGGEFDLIVSDVVMPGMDGPAMARAIRETHPDLPVLFMSGYAEEQLRKDIDIPKMYFLPKPFSVQQIGDKVADVMRGLARK
ncbi:Histidine kinase [Altererythrobacter insulae]|nr:Histidine kinase [Altererythrobacter insulae]